MGAVPAPFWAGLPGGPADVFTAAGWEAAPRAPCTQLASDPAAVYTRHDPVPAGSAGSLASVPGAELSRLAGRAAGPLVPLTHLAEGAVGVHMACRFCYSPDSQDGLTNCKWLLVALFHF